MLGISDVASQHFPMLINITASKVAGFPPENIFRVRVEMAIYIFWASRFLLNNRTLHPINLEVFFQESLNID
jgi:hypothetical protein